MDIKKTFLEGKSSNLKIPVLILLIGCSKIGGLTSKDMGTAKLQNAMAARRNNAFAAATPASGKVESGLSGIYALLASTCRS